jgi:hypothetical protein
MMQMLESSSTKFNVNTGDYRLQLSFVCDVGDSGELIVPGILTTINYA